MVRQHSESSTELMDKDCIEPVLQAMETHLQVKSIQTHAINLLADLAASNLNAPKRIRDKGGVVTVAKTVDHYRGKDNELESLASKLLKSLL
jgi:hypothetical protein